MARYSAFSIFRNALSGQKRWQRAWRAAEPKPSTMSSSSAADTASPSPSTSPRTTASATSPCLRRAMWAAAMSAATPPAHHQGRAAPVLANIRRTLRSPLACRRSRARLLGCSRRRSYALHHNRRARAKILSACVAVDRHSPSAAPRRALHTSFHHVPVLFIRTGRADCDLIVPRSFARSLMESIEDAGTLAG